MGTKKIKITRTSKDLSNLTQTLDKTKTRFQKNHLTIQNHYGDGLWWWGISPKTKLTYFGQTLQNTKKNMKYRANWEKIPQKKKKKKRKKGEKNPQKKKKKKKKKKS